ncbi:hypothetical protein C8F04DRAFT_1196636 [Mycena alexandri]|uniref:Uncharacterized protein n=1 Tax=Mycena alexandri TaxID=1745969 RepID=A0AAD6S5X0_9AGAR|nr:hypothetical protein C8F04DRAFT_1196636 [Mycena alexandri]
MTRPDAMRSAAARDAAHPAAREVAAHHPCATQRLHPRGAAPTTRGGRFDYTKLRRPPTRGACATRRGRQRTVGGHPQPCVVETPVSRERETGEQEEATRRARTRHALRSQAVRVGCRLRSTRQEGMRAANGERRVRAEARDMGRSAARRVRMRHMHPTDHAIRQPIRQRGCAPLTRGRGHERVGNEGGRPREREGRRCGGGGDKKQSKRTLSAARTAGSRASRARSLLFLLAVPPWESGRVRRSAQYTAHADVRAREEDRVSGARKKKQPHRALPPAAALTGAVDSPPPNTPCTYVCSAELQHLNPGARRRLAEKQYEKRSSGRKECCEWVRKAQFVLGSEGRNYAVVPARYKIRSENEDGMECKTDLASLSLHIKQPASGTMAHLYAGVSHGSKKAEGTGATRQVQLQKGKTGTYPLCHHIRKSPPEKRELRTLTAHSSTDLIAQARRLAYQRYEGKRVRACVDDAYGGHGVHQAQICPSIVRADREEDAGGVNDAPSFSADESEEERESNHAEEPAASALGAQRSASTSAQDIASACLADTSTAGMCAAIRSSRISVPVYFLNAFHSADVAKTL